ncbi:MAG: insulinase family protein [Dysgonamonadaceae bacterium]|jgi:predicted Zn-dependent peptidase|nr:insulinase family protein [Dysgonamonadaceae bacterium]
MKQTILLLSALLIWASCSDQKDYQTVYKTDANGYKYEEVTGDPFKARIYTLNNGLKVYLSKNTDEPRIQTIITVKAGAKEDPRDNTGLAHYLEHMLFKGTDHFGTADWEKEKPLLDSISDLFEAHKLAVGPAAKKAIYKKIDAVSQTASQYAISNEYDKITGAIGASGTNAFTSYDLTAYVNDIPANELEPFIKLEYDRFTNLQLRLFHTELETVYEEFNIHQDNGNAMMEQKIMQGLFAKHPYQTDVIGISEHLKNPSMKSVMDYFRKYYVPNNMAICLSGDLDFENAVQVVDRYFGQMKASDDLTRPEPVKEDSITTTKTYEIATPDREQIAVAYRVGDVKSKEALYMELISNILYNEKAGLFDLDLMQKQKVLNIYAWVENMNDYGVFQIVGVPRAGQSLQEVGDLIQQEIQKLKAGDFADDLLEAIINNKKLEQIQLSDNRYSSSYIFLESFISEIEWKDYLSEIDEMAKITKQDVVDFANRFFQNNYVTVYKRTGENKEKINVEKPEITPVTINRDVSSAFADELLAMPVKPIEPVFLDFKKDIEKETITDGIDLYYIPNKTNQIYSFNQFVDISNVTDKKLALAFRYLPYLGTERYTPEELNREMYKLAMSFEAFATTTRSYVTLSGLNETMDRSLALMEEMINHAVVNREAYENLVNDILKKRADNKLNKGLILSGLSNYVKYGSKSSFTDMLTEEELRSIQPQELIDIIKHFSTYKHDYFYFGPDKKSSVVALLKKFSAPSPLIDVPARVQYPELQMDKPVVYFANYDMVQAQILLVAKDGVFDPALIPVEEMFNSYYGTEMYSIVFQEIREARGLAYSAYAVIKNPDWAGSSTYIQGYVGTQVDKTANALTAFRGLLNDMPASEKFFQLSKESVLNNIRSERITKANIFRTYLDLKDKGIDYDYRKPVYEAIQTMTLSDLQKYFDEHVKPARYSVLIIGRKDKVDFKYLSRIAEVKELSLEEVFGY